MVEKMKMVHIVTSASAKDEMIRSLRDIGVMHLAEKQSADREVTDRFQTLSKTQMALKDYAEKKQVPASEILTDDEFNKMYDGVLEAIDRKTALGQEISAANTERANSRRRMSKILRKKVTTSTSIAWAARNSRPCRPKKTCGISALHLSISRMR